MDCRRHEPSQSPNVELCDLVHIHAPRRCPPQSTSQSQIRAPDPRREPPPATLLRRAHRCSSTQTGGHPLPRDALRSWGLVAEYGASSYRPPRHRSVSRSANESVGLHGDAALLTSQGAEESSPSRWRFSSGRGLAADSLDLRTRALALRARFVGVRSSPRSLLWPLAATSIESRSFDSRSRSPVARSAFGSEARGCTCACA